MSTMAIAGTRRNANGTMNVFSRAVRYFRSSASTANEDTAVNCCDPYTALSDYSVRLMFENRPYEMM